MALRHGGRCRGRRNLIADPDQQDSEDALLHLHQGEGRQVGKMGENGTEHSTLSNNGGTQS
jgi:hypothetical protein